MSVYRFYLSIHHDVCDCYNRTGIVVVLPNKAFLPAINMCFLLHEAALLARVASSARQIRDFKTRQLYPEVGRAVFVCLPRLHIYAILMTYVCVCVLRVPVSDNTLLYLCHTQ